MGIKKETIFGSSSLGVYLAINDKFLLVPVSTPDEKIVSFRSVFPENFIIHPMAIHQSTLLGSYIACNSKGILFPDWMLDAELEDYKTFNKERNLNMHVDTIDSKDNALGNLILCNDNGAVISKDLSKYVKTIQSTLDVEVLILNYAGTHLSGSAGVANKNGCLLHPMVSDEEAKMISDVLKVPVDVCTINLGDPFIRAGAVVNSFGGIFGDNSSGPELMRLTQLLKL